MKIRFLRTIVLDPGHMFVAGQIIEVDELTAELRAWLKPLPGGVRRAEIVRDPPEAATIQAAERAMHPPARGRRV